MSVLIGSVLGIDTEFTTLAEAEHALLGLGSAVALPPDAMVCTHEVRDGAPHYAVSITLSTPPNLDLVEAIRHQFPGCPVSSDGSAAPAGIQQAIDEVERRHGGRAFAFPGSGGLRGVLAIRAALERSALDRVTVLGGAPADPDDQLLTRDFVRPRWVSGELVLAVLPAGPNTVAPFEVPNPTACCGGHG